MKEAGLFTFLVTVVLFVLASEAIANDREAAIAYAKEQLEQEGLVDVQPTDAAGVVQASQVVERGRLRDSGAKVVKTTRRMGGKEDSATPWQQSLGALDWEVSEYFEEITAEIGGITMSGRRPLNPEETLQYERDVEGITNEQMATTAEGMADAMGHVMDLAGSFFKKPLFSASTAEQFGDPGGIGDPNKPYKTSLSEFCQAAKSTLANLDDSDKGDATQQKYKDFGLAIALVVGPECFLRSSAEHFRQLKEQTAEEKLQAKKAMEEALNQFVEFVSAELTSVTVGMDLPDTDTPQGSGSPWPENTDQMFASAEQSYWQDDEYNYSWANQNQNVYGSEWRVVPASFQSTTLVGTQSSAGLFGRKAAPAAEGSMKFSRLELTIDRETYKRLGMKMIGTMEQNGQVRPIVMDQVNSDFRMVPGSKMYEPYRETTRLSGLVSPEELVQMRRQLADLDRQLSGMSPGERAQMEQMMGSQLGMMRSMAKDGSIEIVRITTNIEINPALGQSNRGVAGGSLVSDEMLDTITGGELGAGSSQGSGFGQGSGGVLIDQSDLVSMIQTSLNTLGYKAGAVTGELNRTTVVAITQFEAAKGMPVTGQATPQLAGILAAAVDAAQ